MSGLLTKTQQLADVLGKLRTFLESDAAKLSIAFNTTISSLYAVSVRCNVRLGSLLGSLQEQVEHTKLRKTLRALKWPFKATETSRYDFCVKSCRHSLREKGAAHPFAPVP